MIHCICQKGNIMSHRSLRRIAKSPEGVVMSSCRKISKYLTDLHSFVSKLTFARFLYHRNWFFLRYEIQVSLFISWSQTLLSIQVIGKIDISRFLRMAISNRFELKVPFIWYVDSRSKVIFPWHHYFTFDHDISNLVISATENTR